MTDSSDRSDRHSAEQVMDQAAALAAHLDRSGIHWLPNPRPGAVESLGGLVERPVNAAESPPDRSADATAVSRAAATPTSSPRDRADAVAPAAAAAVPSLHRSDPGDRDAQSSYPGDPIAIDQRQAGLDLISSEVSVCTRCDVLSSCRKKTVFGEGHVAPRVAFFGEGPGADEDRTGRPFVGRAGELLTRMIQACSFQREDVYILNTVKCRPPGNRNPEPDEIENCREYYQRQLAVLRPEYIVCLGAVSAQELLKSKLPVGRLRGRFHAYFESKVVVTYHPAYLLRNTSAKKAAWSDLQMMLQDAGIQAG
jgi:uracil-DNA glycosylase family 4